MSSLPVIQGTKRQLAVQAVEAICELVSADQDPHRPTPLQLRANLMKMSTPALATSLLALLLGAGRSGDEDEHEHEDEDERKEASTSIARILDRVGHETLEAWAKETFDLRRDVQNLAASQERQAAASRVPSLELQVKQLTAKLAEAEAEVKDAREAVRSAKAAIKKSNPLALDEDEGITGSTITSVREMSREEIERQGWTVHRDGPPVALTLSSGTVLYPSADLEGNTYGALFGEDKEGTFMLTPDES